MNSPLPQFESSYLTPARLQRVMDVGETTVSEWIKDRELAYFKKGRLIRFAPTDVLAFIARYRVNGRNSKSQEAGLQLLPGSEAWERLERLIVDQVEARLVMKEAA